MQNSNSIDEFILCADESWVNTLNPDPETEKFAPNKKSREVKSGHYVIVKYDFYDPSNRLFTRFFFFKFI